MKLQLRLSTILLILAIVSCSEDKYEETQQMPNKRGCATYVNVCDWRKEVLDLDSIKIDGEIPFFTTKETILSKFGKPTMKSNIGYEFSYSKRLDKIYGTYPPVSTKVENFYYNSSVFEVTGNRAFLKVIDFEDLDIELVHPRITLKKGYNGRELRSIFPESCKLISLPGSNAWSGIIELKASKISRNKLRIYLIFHGSTLSRAIISYYPLF